VRAYITHVPHTHISHVCPTSMQCIDARHSFLRISSLTSRRTCARVCNAPVLSPLFDSIRGFIYEVSMYNAGALEYMHTLPNVLSHSPTHNTSTSRCGQRGWALDRHLPVGLFSSFHVACAVCACTYIADSTSCEYVRVLQTFPPPQTTCHIMTQRKY
jgi:hypothetical protein